MNNNKISIVGPFELSVSKFIREDKTQLSEIQLFGALSNWLKLYIEQELSTVSDIVYHETLPKSIIAMLDVNELRTYDNEYFIWKYMRPILKNYVSEIKKSRPIRIKDKTKFGLQMEFIGFTFGFTSDKASSRAFIPDGNVVVLSLLVAFIVFVVVNKRN